MIPNQLEKVSRSRLFDYDFKNDLISLNCIYFGYAFARNMVRFQIGKDRADEVKGRCWVFLIKGTEEVQARIPDMQPYFRP